MDKRENVIKKIRECSPLVHNITNYVVMNNTANALLAIGASPIMSHAIEEIEDILNISSSLVVSENVPAQKALAIMNEKQITSLLIVADKEIVKTNKSLKGIIHIHQLLQSGIK